jgi:hypothetical protein
MTNPTRITDEDFARAARSLGAEVAALHAVADVESSGAGFLMDGRPTILFERHIMYKKLLAAVGIAEASDWAARRPDIVNPTPGGYQGGSFEWTRLAVAIDINRECALQAASWGMFQIMGFHWQRLGFKSVQDFVNAMYAGESQQLDAFCRFICTDTELHKALVNRDWTGFAVRYNGRGQSGYDVKIARAYVAHSKGA